MNAVSCHGVTRRFGDVVAVSDVSFEVARGEIFGIIGPNGAGKTTLLNCIEGLDTPSSGDIDVLGLDPISDRHALSLKTGVQLQTAALPPRITVAEVLRLFASFYPTAVPWRDLLRNLGLEAKTGSRVDRLSGGERQRVFIALALLHDPELVFLDELTASLDPKARHAMWDLVAGIRTRGKTVVLTTHYMEEAEFLCDRVAIIDRGRLVALDTVQNLIRDHGGSSSARITLAESIPSGTALEQVPHVSSVCVDGLDITVEGTGSYLQGVLASLTEHGVAVGTLATTSPGLEQVFLALTGRSILSEEPE